MTSVKNAINKELKCLCNNVESSLCAYGGKNQLFILLTGSTGAAKSTAAKLVFNATLFENSFANY